MSETEETFEVKGSTVGCLILMLGLAPVAIWHGYVLSKLWLWFAVPVFGVRPISVAMAVGLATLAAMFKTTPKTDSKNVGAETAFKALIHSLVFNAMFLGIGYLIHAFSKGAN